MQDNDEINQIEEWREHQYNPFYWVNKFSPLFPPERTRGFWITSLVALFLDIPVFLAFCWSYFADRNSVSFPFVLIFGVLSVVLTLLAIRFRPDFHGGKRQIKKENRIPNQQKKKKLPKRRKDYR